MVFSSHIFLFYFLPLTLLVYYLLPFSWRGLHLRNSFLTIASYVFYGWNEPWFVVLMFVSTLLDFAAGKMISMKGASQRLKNSALLMSCIGNLGMLAFFKYYMFAAGGINRIAEILGAGSGLVPVLSITLPAGISFYTFQTLSYTIDVWRGNVEPVKNMSSFSCFVALFPQLIAGPIVRYVDIAAQLEKREHRYETFVSGVTIFILGFAKKILLANSAGNIADAVFEAASPTMATAWWGIIAYHFQIYFDFCGYSDMAVGLGRMFGFEFVKNFNSPYHSINITDFWKRWHISLSTWIRDYLYIPLGGNRRGTSRTYLNLFIAMFLCGVWHGANLTFIVWGLFQAFFLIVERIMGKRSLYSRLPGFASVIITNIIVMFGWVLFRSPDLGSALQYWGAMVGFSSPDSASLILENRLFDLNYIIAVFTCAVFVWQPVQAYLWVKELSPVKYALAGAVFIIAVAAMFTQSFNPFLYFQF
ncbi:MAG: MBOAT family protein [Fibrobacter sp.]|nr:MBOAT family protein [Fibrobacter sp.]